MRIPGLFIVASLAACVAGSTLAQKIPALLRDCSTTLWMMSWWVEDW